MDLKPLWGQYVPAMKFHKPWPTGPLLGLESGIPMAEDWSKWSEEELKQRDEAIAAVRKLGYVQTDCRGCNFVRLTNIDMKTSIAMIDFEAVRREKE